jgi:hypothetical protein
MRWKIAILLGLAFGLGCVHHHVNPPSPPPPTPVATPTPTAEPTPTPVPTPRVVVSAFFIKGRYGDFLSKYSRVVDRVLVWAGRDRPDNSDDAAFFERYRDAILADCRAVIASGKRLEWSFGRERMLDPAPQIAMLSEPSGTGKAGERVWDWVDMADVCDECSIAQANADALWIRELVGQAGLPQKPLAAIFSQIQVIPDWDARPSVSAASGRKPRAPLSLGLDEGPGGSTQTPPRFKLSSIAAAPDGVFVGTTLDVVFMEFLFAAEDAGSWESAKAALDWQAAAQFAQLAKAPPNVSGGIVGQAYARNGSIPNYCIVSATYGLTAGYASGNPRVRELRWFSAGRPSGNEDIEATCPGPPTPTDALASLTEGLR